MYVYQEGSKVRINRPSDDTWHGRTGEVIGRSTYADTYMVRVDGEANACWFAESQLLPADLTNVTHADEPSPDEIIADLTNQLNQLHEVCTQYDIKKERCDSLATGVDKAMMIIGDRLIQEAENRGWCDEFDRIIEEVNKELGDATGNSRFQLPTREVEKTVRLMRRRIVTESVEITITVPASADDYEIAEIAEEHACYSDWDDYDDEIDETWVDRIS